MKKILHIFIAFIFLSFAFFGGTKQVYAADCVAPITGVGVTLPEAPATTEHTVSIDMSSNFTDGQDYYLKLENEATSPTFTLGGASTGSCNADGCISISGKVITWNITSQDAFEVDAGAGPNDDKNIDLEGYSSCRLGKITISDQDLPGSGCKIKVYQNRNGTQQCYLNQSASACFEDDVPINIEFTELKNLAGEPWTGLVGINVAQIGFWGGEDEGGNVQATNGTANTSFTPNSSNGAEFEITIEERIWGRNFLNCKFRLTTSETGCSNNQCEPETQLEIGGVPTAVAQEAFSLCKQIPDEFADQRYQCEQCTGGTGEYEGNEGVWTAFGCIKRDPQSILQRLIKVGLGISGGVALLTFLAAGFIFSTSQGDPKAYGKAKEMMTASIVGIIFVIFSVTILQFIGYEILKIPGFGG